jgi:hypothetical protein
VELLGILIAVLLAVLVCLLASVVLRMRRGGDRQPTGMDPASSGAPSASGSLEPPVPAGPVEELSFWVSDPHAPARELFIEFVPPDVAQLTAAKGISRLSETHAGANAFDALINSLPKAAALIESGMVMRVVGPPDAVAGLESGALELVTSGGRRLGQVRDVAGGNFGSHLEVANRHVTPAGGALGVFLVMSVVTGQYYLHRIDQKLSQVQQGIDRLVRGQQSELLGKITAAARLNEQVRRNLLDGIVPNEGDRDDLNHAEQLILAAYGEAQCRVTDLHDAVNFLDLESAKKGDLRQIWARGETEGLTDASILIFAAFTRHQNNLLALTVEPQGDLRRAQNIQERIEEERNSMLGDLKNICSIYEQLGKQRRDDFERFAFGADKLGREAKAFRRRTAPILEFVESPEAQVLPPPPPFELPFMAEVSRGADGRPQVVGALLTQTGER